MGGAYFQDDSLVDKKIMKRNYMMPTKEDKWIDFESVPEVMRVKNFGKVGQTKWTHLVNEDTTNTRNQDDDVMRTIMMQNSRHRKPKASQSLKRPSRITGKKRSRSND